MNYYGMFTDEGNNAVHLLVEAAKALELTWPETYELLEKLSNAERFKEATDTVVREYVYDACKFDTEFYLV